MAAASTGSGAKNDGGQRRLPFGRIDVNTVGRGGSATMGGACKKISASGKQCAGAKVRDRYRKGDRAKMFSFVSLMTFFPIWQYRDESRSKMGEMPPYFEQF